MPIAAQSIHEGKNEPITLICGPKVPLSSRRRARGRGFARREREGRRRLEQLDLRVQFDEPSTTQLASGGEEVGQCAQPGPIRSEGILVRLLRSLDERGRDVETPEGQLDVG